MKLYRIALFILLAGLVSGGWAVALEVQFVRPSANASLVLADDKFVVSILVETNNDRAVLRAADDLAADFSRVTGRKPAVENFFSGGEKTRIVIGTIGQSEIIDRLVAQKKLDVSGISGAWESYVLQAVENPLPGIPRALVIAGSDRRGTIFGIYEVSERIGVSPWNWWADVPVKHQDFISVGGVRLEQGPPAVKYRGIFLNDEDYGLRPWASKTFNPESGNIGPKTYAKVFELLLRLKANCLWPAMHHGSRAFNFYPENKEVADRYGIVMGSSHCEQMLRNNVDEWDETKFGDYNYVSNRAGVLKYWEQRVRENAKFDSLYTLGMRGVHDGAMPGGGTEREKAARLHEIIADQREMLARLVNTNLAQVPQIFCPYKEVLSLYRLAPEIPDDITLVWPDDNYGYVRQFSNAQERRRSGGAGVYYHISYWGAPYNYLWLNSIPPALIAEEMTKAFDYGADKVWIVNVGDLKPGEIGMEFFLRLAWNPHQLDGGAAEDVLLQMAARDFGAELAPDIVKIWNEYFRLNQPRKPEHMGFDEKNWLLKQPAFSAVLNGDETEKRLTDWRRLVKSVDAVEPKLSAEARDAFFELVGYPVRAAAAANEKGLALTRCFATPTNEPAKSAALLEQARQAQAEIHRLTDFYNHQLAGGKWNCMMSDHPGDQAVFQIPANRLTATNVAPAKPAVESEADAEAASHPVPGADFAEVNHRVIIEAEHASAFVPGADAKWKVLRGLGYNGEAVAVSPVTVPVCATPAKILAESPCLQFKTWLRHAGDWKVTLRTLPTFSVETGQPQRYAVAFDDAPPQIVSLKPSTSEKDSWWQENVMRNAAITSSRHTIAAPGLHTLKIWMVDPGIVIDTIAAENGKVPQLGLLWPEETRLAAGK
jgi:hypothetical protein